ncbi:uncharacterized protein [Musca autumnalis]|uniref:uncharacterized protein n=1 Tax=Musca autumnalis TaxID=221902 RepID=UPI003CF291D2
MSLIKGTHKITQTFNGSFPLLMLCLMMGLGCLMLMRVEGSRALNKPKAYASSSTLMKAQPGPLHHHLHRLRRDTYGEEDENYDVIPSFAEAERPKSPGEPISERAEKIAQTFANMWQSMVDTAKHFADALRQLFITEEEEYQLTSEELAARGQAIEYHNEEWRNAYENQL